ncbi:MAG: hypothetical protein ACKON9_19140, partial [Planctomycetaceae bacterium]
MTGLTATTHHGASLNTGPCHWQRAYGVQRGLTQALTERRAPGRFPISTGTRVVRQNSHQANFVV